jgi:hypothetical protein
MPSPPSTRPNDARGRRSSAFIREDTGRLGIVARLPNKRLELTPPLVVELFCEQHSTAAQLSRFSLGRSERHHNDA